MIWRKFRSIKNEKLYPTWPYSQGEMFNFLEKRPLQELYNVIFYTTKGSFRRNQAGYAETESKQLATEIWSMTSDWEVLLIPQKTPNN